MKKLFIILLLATMAFNRIKKVEKQVHATVYHAVPEQTNSDPGHTAFMYKLDLNNPYKHRIIAVSRDLLIEYPNGTKVMVTGTGYDGIYTVRDKMGKWSRHRGKITNSIDILINKGMKLGKWKKAKIRKL